MPKGHVDSIIRRVVVGLISAVQNFDGDCSYCLFVNGGEKSWRWAVEKCGAQEWRIGC